MLIVYANKNKLYIYRIISPTIILLKDYLHPMGHRQGCSDGAPTKIPSTTKRLRNRYRETLASRTAVQWRSDYCKNFHRLRKILQQKRYFKVTHLNPSKLTHFNTDILTRITRAILVKIPVLKCVNFPGYPNDSL